MAKFKKRPVIIDAVKVTAVDFNPSADPMFDGLPFSELPMWIVDALREETVVPRGDDRDYAVWDIKTLEGTMTAEPGDWIIKGVQGELYPCKPDIFRATYEPAEAPQNGH